MSINIILNRTIYILKILYININDYIKINKKNKKKNSNK